MVKIGINGFGRTGRMILRAVLDNNDKYPDMQVVAINDPMMRPSDMVKAFKYDPLHGIYEGNVSTCGSSIMIDGKEIETQQEMEPCNIDWKKNCAQYIFETTGIFNTEERAKVHLCGGYPDRVLVTGAANLPTYVYGVNHESFDPEDKVISLGSPTISSVSPLVKVLHDNFIINYGLMTIVNVTTSSEASGSSNKLERCRKAALSTIVPTLEACENIASVLPDLSGKFKLSAYTASIGNVSVIDLVVKLDKDANPDEVKCQIKLASEGSMKCILGYSDNTTLITQFSGDKRSIIFDANKLLRLDNCFYKLTGYYDAETAYPTRIIEMLDHIVNNECN